MTAKPIDRAILELVMYSIGHVDALGKHDKRFRDLVMRVEDLMLSEGGSADA